MVRVVDSGVNALNLPSKLDAAYLRGKVSSGGAFALGERANLQIAVRRVFADQPETCNAICAKIMLAQSDDEARMVLQKAFCAEEERLQAELGPKKARLDYLNRAQMACNDLVPWFDIKPELQACVGSQFHQVTPEKLLAFSRDLDFRPVEIGIAQGSAALGVFLVQHDWAGLLARADVDAGEIHLPFDYSVFEFEISGRRVCVLMCCEDGSPITMIPIMRAKGGWVVAAAYDIATGVPIPQGEPDAKRDAGLPTFFYEHIRAIAITLDAEVVEATVVRGKHRTNRQASRAERTQHDHHILSLVRSRRRLPPRLSAEPSGRHVRLHFRRGHWRHYRRHKTWIRWCLVGDPSLGFSDKDYAL